MANLIQIKRSDTTAAPTSLANGELAYTGNGDVLFIGSNSVVVPIGGKRVPGTLTANQAIVVNATSYVDQVKTAKLFLTDNTANVTHINATANSTVLGLAANTELTTTWAIKTYVDNKTGSLGASVANTQVVFSDSGTLSGTAAFIFNKTSNTVTLSGPLEAGNTTITGFANVSATLAAGNTTVTGFVNATTTGQFGGTLAAGNTTITGFVNVSSTGQFGGIVSVTDATESSNTTTGSVILSGGLGVAKKINAAEVAVGNTTVYTAITGTSVTTNNVLASATVNAAVLSVGTSFVANTTQVTSSIPLSVTSTAGLGNTTVTGFVNATTTGQFGGTLAAGNTTVTGFVNATTTGQFGGTLAAGNTTVTGFVNATTTGQFGGTLAAGNTTITGFVNATTTGQFGGTLAAGNTTVTGFINASGVGVFGGTLAAGNTTITGFANVSSTLQVDESTTLGQDATSNVIFNSKIGSSVIPFHSASFTLGNTSFLWSAIHVNDVKGANGNFTGNLVVDGDLLVSGNVTTLNTTNLNVEDPLIRLANGNSTTDAVDIGVFGTFGNATVTQHTGLFRDATDGVWKLFAGNIPSLDTATTVDTSNVNFAFADLKVGNFEASKVTTANAQITGGAITGITDLVVADGGTGVSTFTQYGVLFGNNTSAIAATAAGTAGQVLMVSSGGAPEFATLDGGTF